MTILVCNDMEIDYDGSEGNIDILLCIIIACQ